MLTSVRNQVQRRRISAHLLILWTSFLLLQPLLPCCETITAAVAEDHAELHDGVDHGHHEGHHRVPISDHVHCEQIGVDIGALAPCAAERPSPPHPVIAVIGTEDFLGYPVLVTPFRARHHNARSPPIYLLTLRLRI
ncbi:MAG: hypothetical protein HYX63_00215 [Gammaproteobacteria bacterium]|nr:hypothetical protein [Gammaproteobacteria bacterium]